MQKRFVFINVFLLVAAVVALTALGVVMLTSTGSYAQEAKGDPFSLLKRQLVALGVGIVACVVAAIVDYRHLEKKWWLLYATAAVLLALCFVPGIGMSKHGAHRWVNLGQSFQPSEFGKLAAVVVLAWWYARKDTDAKSFIRGFIIPLAAVGGLIGLIAPEVDLGTSALIGCCTLLVMFVAGTRLIYLILLGAAGAACLLAAIQFMPERAGRFMAFLHPEKYHQDDAYQQIQSLIAIGAGGPMGLGLGEGRQKLRYLPFAHTDSIFPIIGEELGLPFTLGVVFCFLMFLVAGVVIATRASDRFGKLLGFGIVTLLALQAILNIGVNTMLLPNKGMPLPFISYGGSNLVFCLTSVGILISIYRHGLGEDRDPQAAFFAVKAKKGGSPRM